MFTLEEIKKAHSKVKSGADFPAYAQEIKKMGVDKYNHFLIDGHTQYHGKSGFTLDGPAKWEEKKISMTASPAEFEKALKHHQKGGSDYLTFCGQAAGLGVERWTVDLHKMCCTYYDTKGTIIYNENIPQTA